MINPNLYLAFDKDQDAARAFAQTICLCRNEDILHPIELIEMTLKDFEAIPGFELVEADKNNGFKVGHNRFKDAEEMFGELKVIGDPIRARYE
jgi:hypothetical protein